MRRLAFCLLSLASLNVFAATEGEEASLAQQEYVDLWELYQEVKDNDPRIAGAEAKARSGAGRQREAFGQLLPQLGADASISRTKRDDTYSTTRYTGERYSVGLSQVLYDPGVWRSYQKYSALAKQREFDYQSAQIISRIDLAERYFATLAAEDELSLVRAELVATERNLNRVQSLYDRKMAMVTDVLELSARVDALKADELEAKGQVDIAREAISELVGRDLVRPLKRIMEHPVFSVPFDEQQTWIDKAVETNPALLAQRYYVKASSSALAEAKADHLPTVSFNLSAQRSDVGYENSMADESDTYAASLGLRIPLYSGGSTSARVYSLGADKDAAEQDYEAMRREVVKETRTAFIGVHTSLSRIEATRKALESAAKSRAATERAFQFGVMNAVDVLNSVKEEFRTRRDFYRSQYNFLTSLLVLHRWSGQLSDEDIRTVNQWLSVPPLENNNSTPSPRLARH